MWHTQIKSCPVQVRCIIGMWLLTNHMRVAQLKKSINNNARSLEKRRTDQGHYVGSWRISIRVHYRLWMVDRFDWMHMSDIGKLWWFCLKFDLLMPLDNFQILKSWHHHFQILLKMLSKNSFINLRKIIGT